MAAKTTKQVTTKTRARKPATKGKRGKRKAQALRANTASIKRQEEPQSTWERLDRQAPKWKLPIVTSAEEAILALGGPDAVSDWLDPIGDQLGPWVKEGFPTGYHLHIYLALADMGYGIDPKVFGL